MGARSSQLLVCGLIQDPPDPRCARVVALVLGGFLPEVELGLSHSHPSQQLAASFLCPRPLRHAHFLTVGQNAGNLTVDRPDERWYVIGIPESALHGGGSKPSRRTIGRFEGRAQFQAVQAELSVVLFSRVKMTTTRGPPLSTRAERCKELAASLPRASKTLECW